MGAFFFFISWSSLNLLAAQERNEKLELVRDFVDFSLKYSLFDQVVQDTQFCLIGSERNTTEKAIESMISMCTNRQYFPRILSAAQVSFKKAEPKDTDLSKSKKLSPDSGRKIAEKDNSSSGKKNSDTDVIHRYLAFALVIPQHAFSRELVDSIQIVAPMFPSITMYFGIAHEFSDLCAQYGVRSFPKLLLFQNGLLVKKYGDSRDAGTLAQQFTRWTSELPCSIPVPIRQRFNTNEPYYHYNRSWFRYISDSSPSSPHIQAAIGGVDSILVQASAGRSVEPMVTLSPSVRGWDFEIFLFSGLYVFVRLISNLFLRQKS